MPTTPATLPARRLMLTSSRPIGRREPPVPVSVKASKAHRVNASIDFAFGEDSHAFYFYLGEAF